MREAILLECPAVRNGKLLRVGTSSWSSDDWKAAGFYPADMAPRDYLGHYARHYPTVEVDSTFYRSPPPSMCARWRDVTPEEFRFSLKVPGEITHEKVLKDCGKDWERFAAAAGELGGKLAFLVLQFGYFNKSSACPSLGAFLERLGPFLESARASCPIVVEVRNRTWVGKELLDALRAGKAVFALTEQEWMPRPHELWRKFGGELLTAGAAYVRFLGERKRIEALTKSWDKTVIDRATELKEILPVLRDFLDRGIPVWAYFNNHYSGHAPASIELLERLLREG
jgi:uncharacterized protein YecE (DUF72 family)